MSVRIQGLDRLKKRLQTLPKEATDIIVAELKAGAQDIRNDAISKVPVDEGRLKGGIVVRNPDTGNQGAEVVVLPAYGGYINFGTGPKAMRGISSRWAQMAQAVRNQPKAGNYQDFIKSLTGWVKRKGLAGTYSVKTKRRLKNKAVQAREDEKLARFLAFKILKNGIAPQPFFTDAIEKNERKIIDRCRRALSQYIRSNR